MVLSFRQNISDIMIIHPSRLFMKSYLLPILLLSISRFPLRVFEDEFITPECITYFGQANNTILRGCAR